MPLTPHPDSLLAKRRDLLYRKPALPAQPPATSPLLYVLYENPSDFPGLYVLRRQRGMEVDRRPVRVGSDYIEVLAALPKNVRPLGKYEGYAKQDPVIKDVWVVMQ